MIRLDRKQRIQLRKQVENRQQKEKAIVEKLLPFLENKQYIATYIPILGEVDVYTPLKDRHPLYVPKVMDEQTMIFCENKQLQQGAYHIWEPNEADEIDKMKLEVILVPMVAFDFPYRMGYGKGYYDRYLKGCNAIKIGVAFDQQQTTLQANPWDVPLDWIVTETRIIGGKR